MMARRALPAYLDGLIAAYRAGQAGRDLHLGYWDAPPDAASCSTPGEFAAAQRRLTERILALAPVPPGRRVLDVACGLGGTLAALAARHADLALTGINIDRRQLELCRDIDLRGGSLALVEADACDLPLAAATFDCVFCVEAMFHFRARRLFLAEAARVLRPGGILLVSDILLRDPGAASPWAVAVIAGALARDYGPWPELWVASGEPQRWAAAAGLDVALSADWTAQTMPSYGIVAPDPWPERLPRPTAGGVLRWLHGNGWLKYGVLVLRRR